MRSRLKMFALVAVLGLISTSCFMFRGFTFSQASIKRGEKNVLTVRLQAPVKEGVGKDYPFILLGFINQGEGDVPNLAVANPKRFDTSKQLFTKPKTMVRDNALRTYLLTNDTCSGFGVEGSDTGTTWDLWRTPGQINDKGRIGKVVLAKLGIRAKANANSQFEFVNIVVGSWADNGDGVPSGGEVICHGGAQTSMTIRNVPVPGRIAPEDVRRELERRSQGL